MAENQESTPNIIESLAMVTDAIQTIFPEGKVICVYELNQTDFKKVQENFRKIDHQHQRFSVDISGLEHVFINEESIKETLEKKEEPKVPETKKKITSKIKSKLSSWFVSRGGSVK